MSFFQQLGCKSGLFAFSCALSGFCDDAVVLCTCEFLPAIELQLFVISARSGFRDVVIVVCIYEFLLAIWLRGPIVLVLFWYAVFVWCFVRFEVCASLCFLESCSFLFDPFVAQRFCRFVLL